MPKENNELKYILNDTRIVILGTFPSATSRNNWFYHKSTNQFWPIMSNIYDCNDICHLKNASEDKEKQLIENRKNFLKECHIGLWDVIKTCDIKGSRDSSIKEQDYNDLSTLKAECPDLKCICFSSKKAFQYYQKYLQKSVKKGEILNWFDNMTNGDKNILPSPSSANAHKTLEQKLEEWKTFLCRYIGQ